MIPGHGARPGRHLRAPRENRSALVDPPWDAIPAMVKANQEARQARTSELDGLDLDRLVCHARRELLQAAAAYTAEYAPLSPHEEALRCLDPPLGPGLLRATAPAAPVARSVASSDPAPCVFLAGHQPFLFHPGVWFKNFALDALARQHRAVAVNLVIDSDTMKSEGVRVPGGTAAEPEATLLPLDDPRPILPFEERRIANPAVFDGFGPRAAELMARLVPDPLIRTFWPLAVQRMQATGNLGAALAQARHQLERHTGLATLEIPQSRVCELPAFLCFAAHLLSRIEGLAAVYNDAVRAYRRAHRIRSPAHPVPDLAVEPPWYEAPFWIWTTDEPRRRRLFVMRRPGELILSDREALQCAIPLPARTGLHRAATRLAELHQAGVKIRSRALITTLWARLVLGDLFIHGIGGAKYDQVTDALIEHLFGLPPPGFLVLSATLLLPVERPHGAAEQARRIERLLRDLTWHPEKTIEQDPSGRSDGEALELIAAKRRLIATPQTPQNARTRWQEFRRLNAALQPYVACQREELLRCRAETAAMLRAESILCWREYAFCLYPERFLHECFAALLPSGRADVHC